MVGGGGVNRGGNEGNSSPRTHEKGAYETQGLCLLQMICVNTFNLCINQKKNYIIINKVVEFFLIYWSARTASTYTGRKETLQNKHITILWKHFK